MTKQDFYTAAGHTKLTEKSIQVAYSYLVDNLTLADTAKTHGVGKERVRQVVAKILRQQTQLRSLTSIQTLP